MQTPRGIATGTPLVNGASQTGNTLVTDGWTTGITNIMRAGDYFHFDTPTSKRELKMITADVNSDGGGNATLTFEPPLRESPANNAALVVSSASCIMLLSADSVARWQNHPAAFSSFVIDCIEAVT